MPSCVTRQESKAGTGLARIHDEISAVEDEIGIETSIAAEVDLYLLRMRTPCAKEEVRGKNGAMSCLWDRGTHPSQCRRAYKEKAEEIRENFNLAQKPRFADRKPLQLPWRRLMSLTLLCPVANGINLTSRIAITEIPYHPGRHARRRRLQPVRCALKNLTTCFLRIGSPRLAISRYSLRAFNLRSRVDFGKISPQIVRRCAENRISTLEPRDRHSTPTKKQNLTNPPSF
jgi:hypothetical protein